MVYPELKKVLATLLPRRNDTFPERIVLEPTAYCNLQCSMCPHPSMKRDKGIMDIGLFRKIADEVAATDKQTALWFALLGEPLSLGPYLFEMIGYAKEKGIQQTSLNTNVTKFMTDEVIELIHKSGLDNIYLSIDAFTQATYSKVRVGGNLNQTTDGCFRLLERAKKEAWQKPKIYVQFIVMDENEHEVEAFREFWLKQDAIVKIRPKLTWGAFSGLEAHNLDNLHSDRIPCSWLIRGLIVLWDGRVAQCDGDNEGKFSPGNLNHETIKDVWNGELKRRREKHWNEEYDYLSCVNCQDWKCTLSQLFTPGESKPKTIPDLHREE